MIIKAVLNVFNRAQSASKKEVAREESRRKTLLTELSRESKTGLTGILDRVESTKRDWEKEDKREALIKSFLDL